MENFSFARNGISFFGFFLAGLAVNLTPCVYPMMTVTASLFKKKDAEEKEAVFYSFMKALFYVLGMAVTYSALGYFAATTGKLFGGILQNKWVLLSVAIMMFLLALSMFGLFQLSVSTTLLNRLGGLRKVSYGGFFFSGMMVGIFAAPCIGPPVIALLTAVANNGNPMFGLWAFFVFSMGLGLPYLLLGTFSGLIAKLPKAGGWLIWIEHAFGIILLGFGFFYLMLALHFDFSRWVWPLGVLIGGVYLGFLEKAGNERIFFKRFKWLIGLASLWIGFSLVLANLPSEKTKLVLKPYSAEAVQESISQKKPVIIDFYAEWCISCHELDQFVFSNPKIIAQLSPFTVLRVDVTNMDDPKAQKIIDQYGVIGLPTVIFLDSHGREIQEARVAGTTAATQFLKSSALLKKQ